MAEKRAAESYVPRDHRMVRRAWPRPALHRVGASTRQPAEEARRTLRELVGMGLPGVWQHPGTDYIESFAPFANLPTQYLITIRRRQRWYGQ